MMSLIVSLVWQSFSVIQHKSSMWVPHGQKEAEAAQLNQYHSPNPHSKTKKTGQLWHFHIYQHHILSHVKVTNKPMVFLICALIIRRDVKFL